MGRYAQKRPQNDRLQNKGGRGMHGAWRLQWYLILKLSFLLFSWTAVDIVNAKIHPRACGMPLTCERQNSSSCGSEMAGHRERQFTWGPNIRPRVPASRQSVIAIFSSLKTTCGYRQIGPIVCRQPVVNKRKKNQLRSSAELSTGFLISVQESFAKLSAGPVENEAKFSCWFCVIFTAWTHL